MAGNLSLSPNSTYSVRVEACNGAGLWSDPAFSNGFRVDITPPVLKGMIFGTGGSIAKASVTEEKLSWTFVDTESPVVEYMVQLGSSPEGAQILPLTSVGRQSFLPLNGLEFAHNSTVYAMVIARNAADLRGVGTFGPVLIDLTPPVLQSPVTAMDGNDVVNVVDSVQINARWSFVDWETDIVEYKVALGSPSDRESYRNFASVGMNSMIRNVTVEVVEGAQMVVSVIAVNAAGLEANATSQTVRFTKAPPSNCSIILLDEQLRALTDAAIYKGITYLSPQTDIKAQLSCSAATLADIADISFRLAKDGGQMFDWVPIGPHDILTIESGGLPKLDTMTLEVRANNAAGLWSDFRSAPFRISSQQPVPGAVTLEWRNGTDAASAKNLVVAISAFKDANAPTYPVNHTLGVFSSDSVGAYNIYSLEALKPDSTGSLAPVVIPVTSSAKGRNFTAVVRGVGLLGLETRVITMLPGA
ncbi:uncharacterized protein EV422DRAFT_160586 [Fimicolochytrium jonesii]|uniref:uncharacterized protein n=1 Tax=Fimicolochytrium jonesii TaxID=1396493 RepID=UPI0022FE3313|nr:uncharacterized protein EV422DRAFT_160586 [Fimicolochytrium jonesii]KAI8826275.1 hypothetical protein EV422DRAFT_160586 [Fimicolochytrium jonesii]